MQIQRFQNLAASFAIISEVSHTFCCVLPSMFSILTVLVGLGAIGAMPLWLEGLHTVMHGWEVPMLFASFVVLALGWALHLVSKRLDCRSTGCGHKPCGAKKRDAAKILKIASILFFINVSIYTFAHVPTNMHPSDHHADGHIH